MVCVEEPHMKTFCENYSLKNLMKQPTCYENPAKPTRIYSILTYLVASKARVLYLHGYRDRFVRFSFNNIDCSVTKKAVKKFQPRIVKYRSYKHFLNEGFRKDLPERL